MRRRPVIAVLLAAVALTQACRHDEPDRSADTDSVETHLERGPVSLTVRATPATVTVGEPLHLAIEVVAPDGVEIKMPDPPEGDLGPFAVRSTQTPPDVPVPEGRLYRHVWTLDTFAAGGNEIPGVTVTFTDGRPGSATPAGPVHGELESDPLAVTVRSVLAADQAEEDLRDIKPEVRNFLGVDLASLWPAAVVVAVGLAVAVAAILIARRRRALQPVEPVVPPGDWARSQLDDLERRRLVEQGKTHEFYFRLSDIVRQYLERRFELMAPERTTEEFLHEARRSTALGDDHKHLLAEFLRAADMVKFALHEPSVAESGLALTAARGFVEETAETVAPPGPPPMEDAA